MLLNDIINLATDSKQPITDLLRKCIVLGYQLKNERLKTWATKELNGYDITDELPSYRVFAIIAKGNFSGPFGSQLRNWEIAPMLLEERHRDWATTCPLIHPISGYENLAGDGEGTVETPWDPNLVLYYQHKLSNRGYLLISAWQELSKAGLIGMLDIVRNRVLNMALEIQTEIGEKDEDLKNVTAEDREKVDHTVVTHIYGGNVYLSTGYSLLNATTVQQTQQNIAIGDWEHLSSVLREAGLSGDDLKELSSTMGEDDKKLGGKVKAWIAKTAPKVLSGGVKIGAEVGKTLLTEYLKQYCGLS